MVTVPDLSGDDNELKKPTGHANLIASGKGDRVAVFPLFVLGQST